MLKAFEIRAVGRVFEHQPGRPALVVFLSLYFELAQGDGDAILRLRGAGLALFRLGDFIEAEQQHLAGPEHVETTLEEGELIGRALRGFGADGDVGDHAGGQRSSAAHLFQIF